MTEATFVGPPRSRSIAIMLAVLLGGLGIHKFYTNRPGWGVLYVAFCWTFVPMILGLIEGLLWLGMSDAKFQERVMQNGGQRSDADDLEKENEQILWWIILFFGVLIVASLYSQFA